MTRISYNIILLAVLCFGQAFVQAGFHRSSNPINSAKSREVRFAGQDLTVSYSIGLKSRRSNTGIGETYNGGVETIFANDQEVRLRLVSLMRMQSIFILSDGRAQQKVIILKESGKNRYK
jgi:hypothetical protein